MSRGDRLRTLVVAAVAAVALAGCPSVMGFEDVVVDRDRDNITDSVDICPGDYDPLQLDTDHNGTGDACDACVRATYDLDGDGRDDSCDACIGAGPSGIDTDEDGIDDGCDPCVGGTGTTGSDIDGDSLDDGCDACIGNGIDLDRDGVDDNCDVCLFGRDDEDEDGDGVADGCDVCPADPDPGQEHAADEDLGFACDPSSQRNDVRRMFDGFSELHRGIWVDNAAWTTMDGAVTVKGATGRRAAYYSVRAEFVIRTFVRFTPGSPAGSNLNIVAWAERGIRLSQITCGVDSAGSLTLDGTTDGTAPLDTSKGVLLRVSRSIVPQSGARTISCEAVDGNGTKAVMTASTVSSEDLDVALDSSGASGSYEWVDVIDHPLPLAVSTFK